MTVFPRLLFRCLKALVYVELTHAAPALTLPPGVDRLTFDRLHALGFDVDTALWLSDFDSLTHQVLHRFDGAVA